MLKSLKGFTGVGIAGTLATLIASPDVLGLLPEKYATILTTLSACLAAFGIRRRLPSA